MVWLTAVFCLSAADARPKLVVQDIAIGAGVDAALSQSLSSRLAAELTRRRVHEVLTSHDIATSLGQERQRQLLGCSEEATSCLTELANAMGAQFVMTGALVRLGSSWQLTLQTVDSRTARSVGRAVRVAGDPAELVAGWPLTVAEAAGLAPPEEPSRAAPVVLASLGAAAAVGGGVVLLQTLFREGELDTELRLADSNPSVLRPVAAYEADLASLQRQRLLGWGLLGGGLTVAASGALWLWLSGDSSVRLSVVATPGRVSLGLAGSLP